MLPHSDVSEWLQGQQPLFSESWMLFREIYLEESAHQYFTEVVHALLLVREKTRKRGWREKVATA